MMNMLYRKNRVNDGFSVSKLEISMLQTRNTENRPKNTKTWNCKHCWMKMIHKHKNNSQSNWALVNKLFPIAYERWERFRKSAVRCHMNWMRETDGERRKNTCEILLERYRRKSFLHRIVTGDEKWIFFENPKRKKSWVDPSTSTARPNRFGRKMLCVWWDQKGVVYYKLLKPGETVNTAINNNWSIWTVRFLKNDQKRQHKIIFLHDNAPSHTAKSVRDTEALG